MQEKFPLKGIKGNKKEKIVLLFGKLWIFHSAICGIFCVFLHFFCIIYWI